MKIPFSIGDTKTFSRIITEADVAAFEAGVVHPVYATFALARDAEWSGRLFVLEMKEAHEEGIGSGLEIKHRSPALLGSTVHFTATLEAVNGNEVITVFSAKVGERLIATGRQWQRVLVKEKIEALFAGIA